MGYESQELFMKLSSLAFLIAMRPLNESLNMTAPVYKSNWSIHVRASTIAANSGFIDDVA